MWDVPCRQRDRGSFAEILRRREKAFKQHVCGPIRNFVEMEGEVSGKGKIGIKRSRRGSARQRSILGLQLADCLALVGVGAHSPGGGQSGG